MCKYFIEIVKAANFGQNPYKLSFAIQYRETSHSPSPPVESSYVQISPSIRAMVIALASHFRRGFSVGEIHCLGRLNREGSPERFSRS